MTRSHTQTTLFITKIQIVRPVVNAKFTFTGATISNKSITGEVGTMSWGNQWTPYPTIDSDMLRVGNISDGVVNLVGDAAGAKDLVTITFDMGLVQLINKNAEFKVTDVNSTVLVDESFCVYSNTGFETGKNTLGFAIGDFVSKGGTDNPGMTNDTKNTFTLTFDYATKKITGNVVNKNGTKSYTTDMPDGAGAVASFVVRSGYNNEGRRCYFDNLLITTTPGDYTVVDADYTVKFVDEEGKEIKESITRSGTPGSSIAATTGDMESFWASTKKYFYKSDDAEGKTIAADGSTILTITYREAGTFSYAVNSSLGTLICSGSTAEGESVTVPYPTYELYEGKLYKTGAINDGGKQYSKTFTVNTNNQTETINYSENTSNVVFYSEGEDVSGITSTTVGNAGVRGSMCAAGYNGTGGNVTVTTLTEVGIYKITICTYGSKGSYTFTFKADDTSIVTAEYPGTNGPTYSGIFPVSSSTDIVWPATDANHAIDYIYIEKLSSSTTVSTTLGTNGYATFASPYALDLTTANLPSGVKAYKAAIEGTTVKFTVLDQCVPANTGVLLEGGKDATVNILVAANSTTITGNDFLVNTTGETFDAESGYTYYGMMKATTADDAIVFATFAPGSVAIPADKAYLKVSNGSAARLSVVFEESTGISTVETVKAQNGETYNLSGQRVAQPQKGLYIVNGKKVIIK